MAGSISAKQITAAAKASAKALQAHLPDHPRFDIGFSPPPWWWVGFVIQHHRDDLKLTDAEKISTELHKAIAEQVPTIKGGKPGVVLVDGRITLGFIPPIDVNIIHE